MHRASLDSAKTANQSRPKLPCRSGLSVERKLGPRALGHGATRVGRKRGRQRASGRWRRTGPGWCWCWAVPRAGERPRWRRRARGLREGDADKRGPLVSRTGTNAAEPERGDACGDAGLKRRRGARVVRKERKGAGLGCEGKRWAAREGKETRAGPLRVRFGLSIFLSLFYFKHHLNLFEFKLKFEFNSYAFKQNKAMHQHECTNILTL